MELFTTRGKQVICLIFVFFVITVQSISLIQTRASSKLFSKRQLVDREPAVGAIEVQTAEGGVPWLNFRDGHDLQTFYSGPEHLSRLIEQNLANPLSLASADFDEDGVVDLVNGYAVQSQGIVVLHRGNVDALYPNSPEVHLRKASGTFIDSPFLPTASIFEVKENPGLLEAGDFDADGHMDLVVAKVGGTLLHLLSGDGTGRFKSGQALTLPGSLTSLTAGEINRPDGLKDLVTGVTAPDGAKLLIFEGSKGALRASPEVLSLPFEATSLALGQLDESYEMDLAIGAGSELLIVHGRDRKLSLDETKRAGVPRPIIDKLAFPFRIVSVATGDFTADNRTDLALLSESDTVQIFERSNQPGNNTKWHEINRTEITTARRQSIGSLRNKLLTAKVSGWPGDDLLVVNDTENGLQILDGIGQPQSKEFATSQMKSALETFALDLGGEPVALLPMRLNDDQLTDLVLLRAGNRRGLVLALSATEKTFIVNSAVDKSDSNLADGICNDGTGNCTLRAAIEQANASPGTDAIHFSIGSGAQTIKPATQLPEIIDPIIIDGTTQPGFSGSPIIELSGAGVVGMIPPRNGLIISAGNSIVRGLLINSFADDQLVLKSNGGNIVEGNFIGVDISGTASVGANSGDQVGIRVGSSDNLIGGTTAAARNLISGLKPQYSYSVAVFIDNASGNRVQGNLIGTDVTGTLALGNSAGVSISHGDNNIVGGVTAGAGNVISANNSGLGIGYIAKGNLVQGNFIGTDITGTVALGNDRNGVGLGDRVSDNLIGGTTVGARNVISANLGNGIVISNDDDEPGNYVQGNFIGTDITGTVDLGNGESGVFIDGFSNGNIIGGTVEGARNIISGNQGYGILIEGSSSQNHLVQGNYIGTDVAGRVKLGNSLSGIRIFNSTFNNTIGGTTAEARNVISGNAGNGIETESSGNITRIIGNFIGTDAGGTFDLGNGQNGILITSSLTRIGGMADGEANRIAFNGLNGITIESSTRHTILSNTFFSNGGLAIDFGNDGVTPNDIGDIDLGINNRQNYPLLTSVITDGENLTVVGTLSSAARKEYLIQLFSSTDRDPSGHGEGQFLLGDINVITDSSGNGNFVATLPGSFFPGQYITATAFDPVSSDVFPPQPTEFADSSEFSNSVEIKALSGSAPLITDISPGSGIAGEEIVITGENFSDATGVSFNAVGASQFTVLSPNTIKAVVPLSATTGPISVTTPGGSRRSNTIFKVLPKINFFGPDAALVGEVIRISGSGLLNPIVKIGDVGAEVISSSSIKVEIKVPAEATTGKINLITADGTDVSAIDLIVIRTPVVTSFTPESGITGTTVVISGTNFIKVTSVLIGSRSAGFKVDSETSIRVTVPAAGITGPLSVVNRAGTGKSPTDFVVLPMIDSLTPTSDGVGGFVKINGSGFTGATEVKFNGVNSQFKVDSFATISATVPAGATTGPISVITPSGMAMSNTNFEVLPKALPRIDSFTPESGLVGTTVKISGFSFTGTTGVKINGVNAGFSIDSDTLITATVPSTAITGTISLSTPAGSTTTQRIFRVLPKIDSFTPTGGLPGASVTITGSGFSEGTRVLFPVVESFNVTIVSSNTITTVVPSGTITGKIRVSTPFGFASSSTDFIVFGVRDFNPRSAPVGAIVTIEGDGFTGATAVKFNQTASVFRVISDSKIEATVPSGATNGPISVISPKGTLTSRTSFNVGPKITSFTPVAGVVGSVVSISGSNFTGATSVRFSGVEATTFTVISASLISATVPPCPLSSQINVSTPSGTTTSVNFFKLLPSITGFSPASALPGETITITGNNFFGATAVRFGSLNATSFTVDSNSQIRAQVPGNATGLVKITILTQNGTGPASTDSLVVLRTPLISSFTPVSGTVGTVVTINGTNISSAAEVRINNVIAVPIKVVSPSAITITIPPGASTGKISATNRAGTSTSTAVFKVLPKITSFTPASGIPGESITINGTNFGNKPTVRIGSAIAPIASASDTQIIVTIPTTAITGKISAATSDGTATSTSVLIVIKPPTISSFSPTSGPVGTIISISGTNLSSVTDLKFNGISAGPITVVTPTLIRFTVPIGATTGKISVTNRAGTNTSVGIFKVLPKVTSFSPPSAVTGETININGSNFTGATAVRFGTVLATPFTVNSDTEISVKVPAAAITGKVSVSTPDGTGTSVNNFTVIKPPTISSFTPTSGRVGTVVTISGANLSSVIEVKFGATSVEIPITIISLTSIKVTVPAGATTGKITVINRAGTITSTGTFTVLP
jgi:hypothetical protein